MDLKGEVFMEGKEAESKKKMLPFTTDSLGLHCTAFHKVHLCKLLQIHLVELACRESISANLLPLP